jgi:hypothetical protein
VGVRSRRRTVLPHAAPPRGLVRVPRLVGAGFEVECELRANGAEAAYFDTRTAIGCYTEIHSDPERIVATFARWKAAHLEWDGSTDPLRGRLSGS